MNGKQVAAALRDNGWVLERISGSHHIYFKAGKICPVPIHGKKDLAPGTLAKIRRLTGLKL